MKKNFLYIAAAAVLGFSSCGELDRFPKEELSDASFWKSVTDAEMAVSDLYPSLPDIVGTVDEAINPYPLGHRYPLRYYLQPT